MFLCGDDLGSWTVLENVGVSVGEEASSDFTTVLPAPMTITSSFDIARLKKNLNLLKI